MTNHDPDPMTVARFYFPGQTDSFIEYVIWSATGYPAFFSGDPIRCFSKQLHRASRLLRKGALDRYIEWSWSPRRISESGGRFVP